MRGLAPNGSHYYPAFPYASYAFMDIGDVNDLWGYMQTLPESDNEVSDHEVFFPFNINRAIGLWKYLYMPEEPYVPIDPTDTELRRDRIRDALLTIGEWSAEDLAYFFEAGFTPDFDTVGGEMVAVQRELAKLTDEDRAAIAAYLKAVPEH